LAWSPDPNYDDLIAVGLSNGKVELTRLEGTRSATSQAWTKPLVSLNAKTSRSCNALAFCNTDPNYLAVGSEKIRGDFGLVVWDLVSAAPSLSVRSPSNSQLTFNLPPPGAPPRPEPLIARAEPAPKHDGRILQQHASGEAVSSVAFLPRSTTLLLASVSYRWLRLYDLRTPQPGVISASSKIHGIATDPFDPHRIACFGDGIATIWDSRRMSHPLLTFTERDAAADGAKNRINSAFVNIEFSPTRRGVLATLERDANHVRFWDLQQFDVVDRSPERSHSRDSTQSRRAPRLSWANPSNILQWSASSGSQVSMATPGERDRSQSQVVLAGTKRSV
jgi:WD repeat-containing protein mio